MKYITQWQTVLAYYFEESQTQGIFASTTKIFKSFLDMFSISLPVLKFGTNQTLIWRTTLMSVSRKALVYIMFCYACNFILSWRYLPIKDLSNILLWRVLSYYV